MVPSLVLHNHEHDEVVALSEADSCEKAIYHGIHDEHKEHISKSLVKCWFCDQHTMPFQLIVENEFGLPDFDFYVEYSIYYKSFHSIALIGNSNKDPPFSI